MVSTFTTSRSLLEYNTTTGECVPGVYQAGLFPYKYTGNGSHS